MSTTTTNFGITLPEGADTFNPLIFNNDAFTLIDSIMRTIKNATVGSANQVISEDVNTITRTDSNTSTFIFVASSDYEVTQKFYVDGVPVTVRYSDGSAPKNGAYRTNQAVLCHLNGNILTLFISRITEMSHVGMIIHSTTLATEQAVKAIYGGNSWAKIEGRFLLGQSNSYPINSTGGEALHALNLDEIPSHRHVVYGSPNTGNTDANSLNANIVGNRKFAANANTGYAGGGQPHNNMPPYKTVYIWERIA